MGARGGSRLGSERPNPLSEGADLEHDDPSTRACGRASSGHMNPAITLAVWRYKAFPGCGVPYDVLAQLAGSALGPILGRLVWGSTVARTPVVCAALQPAAGWTFWDLFGVEAATVALIVLIVGLFSSVPRLARVVPYVVGFLVGAAIAGLGTITGGSANPVRQFGPAIVSGRTHLLLAYMLAPLFAALSAPAITSLLSMSFLGTHPPAWAIRPSLVIRRPQARIGHPLRQRIRSRCVVLDDRRRSTDGVDDSSPY